MSGVKFKQGYFSPKHPEKYKGDLKKGIFYRSSWELQFFNFLDNNPNVLQWCSEGIAIPYIKPTDGRVHKYFPDIFVCYRNKAGEEKRELIEIKPKKETKNPRKNSKHILYEQLTLAINVAKWVAAQEWCKTQSQQTKKEITFRIITENQIFK